MSKHQLWLAVNRTIYISKYLATMICVTWRYGLSCNKFRYIVVYQCSWFKYSVQFVHCSYINKPVKEPEGHRQHPFRSFLESTSVKGVSRAAKTSSGCVRLLWVTTVIVGAGFASFFLYGLLSSYLSLEVSSGLKSTRNSTQEFPAITLCNLNPLANTGENTSDVMEYFNFIDSILREIEEDTAAHIAIGNLMQPGPIFENTVLRSRDKGKAGDPKGFVTSCRWHSDTWYQEAECLASQNIVIYKTTFGFCSTFQPPGNASYISGFSAILYLDNMPTFSIPLYDLDWQQPFALGAYLIVHPRNTWPDFNYGTILNAGEDTYVYLTTTHRKLAQPPYSNCSVDVSKRELFQYVYSRSSCLDFCIVEHILKTCDCFHGAIAAIPIDYMGKGLCSSVNISAFPMDIAKVAKSRSQCLRAVVEHTDQCDARCLDKCFTVHHEIEQDRIPWPHVTTQLAFWNKYIKSKPYAHHFIPYQELWENRESDPIGTLVQLGSMSLIQDNYLRVRPMAFLTFMD